MAIFGKMVAWQGVLGCFNIPAMLRIISSKLPGNNKTANTVAQADIAKPIIEYAIVIPAYVGHGY